MCGIAGIVNARAGVRVSEGELRAMCDAIRHRGPDDAGYHLDGGVGLGMRRLSIIDVAGGHQPIFNEDRSKVIVYNGEIYNHRDVRAELEKRGHRYTTRTDTESILHAYEEYGDACVTHLRGMFGIAIWDTTRQRLFLARDRLGKKPLYYTHPSGPAGRLAFASEVKALLTLPGVERRVDAQALADYAAWGYVPDPLSIYRGIAKLPPAHYLVYEGGEVRVQKYWDVDYSTAGEQDEVQVVDRVLDLLDDAVRMRLMSDVPLGAFLSGGTDSSVVVALMARHTPGRVKTFSIGFDEAQYNELPYARRVAEHFGTEHHEEVVRPDAERDVLALVRQFDEPFSDSSMIPTYYVSRLARRHVTVALSGDGGDELFAGYLRYLDAPEVRAANRVPAVLRDAILGPVTGAMPAGARGIDRLRNLMGGADDQYVRHMSGGISRTLHEVFEADFLRGIEDPARVAAPFLASVRDADPLSRRQYLDTHTYLPGDILTKVDRASMMVSLEARAPLLDHVLAEFAATIPVGLRMKGMTTKYILKKVAERLMPAELVHRPKMGFAVPVAFWLRKEWAARSDDLVRGERALARGTFRQEYLNRIMDEHRAGKRDNSAMIWRLMILELWYREWVDGSGAGN
ncbi:MAG: asparagine synthase (glutamine-hydrolyzing) [Candidatus Krumholzibacteria bacterium]|nr:asparagine synthase (glutamine-hydrolyzing) [Candidatus Krumholzibacteria bacterium]MDH4337594.1 asparagine synthase (glutamine-hydrolyzing) [Candidatus Krumholzibacteria bacterium]MDH5270396.1 asparagine synthase (glutamine-hydrolyzing) [Candidatus Krumholzibacteria bacterium]